MKNNYLTNVVIVMTLFINYLRVSLTQSISEVCPSPNITFEIITGMVYTAPSDTLELVPGTLHLPECLHYCRVNASCRSVNFETGLCVLFSSSAKDRPSALTSSQFPVFTIYAHKLCFKRVEPCQREWAFERVFGGELLDRARKKTNADSANACMELCLEEKDFECRSVNYRQGTAECMLNDADRHSVSPHKVFVPVEDGGTDYLENNCVDLPMRLCEFKKIAGKILKTVDAVYQDVKTLDDCRRRCLTADFRCQAFDLGDPTNSVCRLSHLSSASLSHIEDPYLEIPGAATFETASCYNVTIRCRSREMVAFIHTSRLFNGKVYARSRPNSCVTDVVNSMDFEIRMAYHDLDCDVKQQSVSEFTNDIVIQHHDMIVTNQDLGVTVHCHYDLANKSVIADTVRLNVSDLYSSSDLGEQGVRSVNVGSPNVTMRVTNRFGSELTTAQVGDPLSLHFEITDKDSPYEIFVRELVAMDGLDNSEILLIDALGCPTDPIVMGAVTRTTSQTKSLTAPFDAFKFPTSEIVQFKALVTPCLSKCEPAECKVHSFEDGNPQSESMGKRRRRKRSSSDSFPHGNLEGDGHFPDDASSSEDEEVIVVKTIRITDKFGFERIAADGDSSSEIETNDSFENIGGISAASCMNLASLVISCSLFLVAQLMVLLAYAFVWRRRNVKHKLKTDGSVDMIYNHRRESNCGDICGLDNSYHSDITPYDTVYNLPRPQTRHY